MTSSLDFSFSLETNNLDLLRISGIDFEAFDFQRTPFLKVPVIRTPVLEQNSYPQPFFSPFSKRPQQTQSWVVSLPSPWYNPFSINPMYFQFCFSTQNFPVFLPSLNSPFILLLSFKFSSTPRPCLNPLRNYPKQILPSQKRRNPSYMHSLSMGYPKQMQFLNFFMEGFLMMISQERQRLLKKLNIYEGSDFSVIFVYFQRYYCTVCQFISRIFLRLSSFTFIEISFFRACLTI